jgi:peptidoglycan/xylan/chitin deacetylase (PgdA/CDA1 family)
MKVAFTIDDLPLWPHSQYPEGWTAERITDALLVALEKHRIAGVFAFSNSKPLIDDPSLSIIFDQWTDSGHYVANHTHSHPFIHRVSAREYIEDIERAAEHLSPWISRSPGKYFRYTRNLWGETEEKRQTVKAYLDAAGYRIAEVTTWFYEWEWNKAFEKYLLTRDQERIDSLKTAFIEFSMTQLKYDARAAAECFGKEIKGIILGHNLPFMAEIADALFARFIDEGVEFISLEEASDDPFYRKAAGFVSERFLVYWQKLALHLGMAYPVISPDGEAAFREMQKISPYRYA